MIVRSRLALLVVFIASVTAAPQAWPHDARLDGYACPNHRSAGESVPHEAGEPGLCIVQERTHRQGVLLVVDALVENISPGRVDGVEVSVEFYNFFDKLVSLEYTVLLPPTLGPGHTGALRVATCFTDTIRKVGYRFTWWQNGKQFQKVVRRHMKLE